jgi:hypothetical protein
VSGGHLNFKIPCAGSFYNLMEIAEYYYYVRMAGMRGRGVYILRADGKCDPDYGLKCCEGLQYGAGMHHLHYGTIEDFK